MLRRSIIQAQIAPSEWMGPKPYSGEGNWAGRTRPSHRGYAQAGGAVSILNGPPDGTTMVA